MERGFSLNKHIVDEARVNLKQHTISALCTVNKYKEVENIAVTRALICQYCSTHAAYTEYLSTLQKEAKASDHEKQERLKRARDTETQQQKQTDICKKQKEA